MRSNGCVASRVSARNPRSSVPCLTTDSTLRRRTWPGPSSGSRYSTRAGDRGAVATSARGMTSILAPPGRCRQARGSFASTRGPPVPGSTRSDLSGAAHHAIPRRPTRCGLAPDRRSVRAYDHLTIGEIRELGHDAAGLRERCSLRRISSARARNRSAAAGLSRRMYSIATRNWMRPAGVNRTLTDYRAQESRPRQPVRYPDRNRSPQ